MLKNIQINNNMLNLSNSKFAMGKIFYPLSSSPLNLIISFCTVIITWIIKKGPIYQCFTLHL